MGISASQARLLSITARLSSNEYESQQVSNAKMRLATQSEEASSNYLSALNATQMMFRTYDAQGDAINTELTANVLYQYSDMKNQYSIVNTSGQILISSLDARNFEIAKNLDEFLEKYGVKKVYKTENLQKNADLISSDEYKAVYDEWDALITSIQQRNDFSGKYSDYDENDALTRREYSNVSSEQAFEYDSYGAYIDYNKAEIELKNLMLSDAPQSDIDAALEIYEKANQALLNCSTYQNWCNAKAMDEAQSIMVTMNGESISLSDAITEYFDRVEEFKREATDLDYTTITDTYTYSDPTKAQWYTNLWYRLNGESSNKTSQGELNSNYQIIDSKLASSTQWIQDSLKQGIISLEMVSVNDSGVVLENQIERLSDTLNIKLTGISWNKKIHTSSSDFVSTDANDKVAKAEAEYERKTAEISAKDQKYQNKIKKLDIEHQALKEQYDSVKAAMEKNIGRSFKTFNT